MQLINKQFPVATLTAIVATAGFVGLAVAKEKLLYLVPLVVLAFVIMFPIEMSLGLFAFSIPFDTVLVLGNSNTTVSWGAGAFAGAVLLGYGLVTRQFRTPSRAASWWALFLLWSAVTVLWALDRETALQRLPTVLGFLPLYLAAVCLPIKKQELSRICMLAVLGGTLAALMMIYQDHATGFQDRATIGFGDRKANPNDLACNLILPFSLSLAGAFTPGKRLRRLAMLGAMALLIAAIFLTMSRGVLLAVMAVLGTYCFRVGINRRMVGALVIVLIPLLFLPSLFYERWKEAPEGRGTGRLDIFIAGLQIVKSNPVLGVGIENFGVAYDKYAGNAPVFRGFGRAAHNAFLQVWGESGVIGLFFFLTAIFMEMKQRRGTPGEVSNIAFAIEGACWGMLVASLSGNIHWSKAFWLCFMLLAIVTRQANTAIVHSYSDRGESIPRRIHNVEAFG